MDLDTVTLEQALQVMSLPRVVCQDAEGEQITAQNGRFGPYLKKGTDSRSIGSEEEIFTITLEQALEIYSQPKQRGARAARLGMLVLPSLIVLAAVGVTAGVAIAATRSTSASLAKVEAMEVTVACSPWAFSRRQGSGATRASRTRSCSCRSAVG